MSGIKAFIVRIADTCELVGVYAARDLRALWGLVDEHVDASVCEAAEMSAGGVFFGRRAPVYPFIYDDDSADTLSADGEPSANDAEWCLTATWFVAEPTDWRMAYLGRPESAK